MTGSNACKFNAEIYRLLKKLDLEEKQPSHNSADKITKKNDHISSSSLFDESKFIGNRQTDEAFAFFSDSIKTMPLNKKMKRAPLIMTHYVLVKSKT